MTLKPDTIRIHGRDVTYIDHGDGPVLLFIHGIGGDWTTWEPVLAP